MLNQHKIHRVPSSNTQNNDPLLDDIKSIFNFAGKQIDKFTDIPKNLSEGAKNTVTNTSEGAKNALNNLSKGAENAASGLGEGLKDLPLIIGGVAAIIVGGLVFYSLTGNKRSNNENHSYSGAHISKKMRLA